MELRVLRYFLAVVREGNITRAAEALHLSQPALSKQIIELEEELGQQLLIRGSRKVTLTEYGKILEQRAREILDIVQQTEDEFSGNDRALGGDLRVGCGEGRPVELVARAMGRMYRQHPGVMMHIYTGITGDVIDRLNQGALDFGAVSAASASGEYNFLRLPLDDRWGPLMRRDDPLSRQDAITAEMLLQLPVVISRHALVRNELSGWLGKSMQELRIAGTCDMHRNAALLVREGLGYLLSYDLSLADDSLCFKPLEPRFVSTTNMVWKKSEPLSPAAREFLRMMREEVAGEGEL